MGSYNLIHLIEKEKGINIEVDFYNFAIPSIGEEEEGKFLSIADAIMRVDWYAPP